MENMTINQCINSEVQLEQMIEVLEQYSNLLINGIVFDHTTEAEALINKYENQKDLETLPGQIKEFFQKYLDNGGTPIEEIDTYLNDLYKDKQICLEEETTQEGESETYEISPDDIPAMDSPEFEQMCDDLTKDEDSLQEIDEKYEEEDEDPDSHSLC